MLGRVRTGRLDPAPPDAGYAPVDREEVSAIVVNLARRSQSLVERQLRVLEELEREERDPARLAELFRLERLTAHMRRTNENLLVLAGTSARRRGREPVPLAALILAAVSENDSYQRVRAEVEDGLQVSGLVAADLVHMLAEILDNAAGYSPPTSTIQVSGRGTREGAMIAIVDQGIGMKPEVFEELNSVLATPPGVTAAVTERMGLVVVGHLAARHGITVRLADAAPGVRVTVHLPASVLHGRPEPVAETREADVRMRLNPAGGELGFLDGETTMRLTYQEDNTVVLLPTRVPMASMPSTPAPDPEATALSPAEPAIERVLTRLYDGLRGGS
ncbi:sensor histidine kinase [Hamadaea tsunoensis]|uniref:sensor histidine kinase n=1 Tax=Hamadaea tsunoensis TaxID=53368 RepID=UPI00040069D9|nr:ATP-binding protein [Hamadaea tsunoensis]